jgi:hypothetical protein
MIPEIKMFVLMIEDFCANECVLPLNSVVSFLNEPVFQAHLNGLTFEFTDVDFSKIEPVPPHVKPVMWDEKEPLVKITFTATIKVVNNNA